jgi:uncharacterized protein YcfJ
MKAWIAALSIGGIVLAAPAANARGCWEGAIVGAVVGHYAGHHAILGAVGGCAFGKIIYKEYQEYKTDHPDERITFTKYLTNNKDELAKRMQVYKESNGADSGAPGSKSQ